MRHTAKHTAKAALAALVSALLLALCVAPLSYAQEESYMITSPYDGVDWETWGAYKACLHTHTVFSDGTESLADVVEEYYRQGYDILSLTDHGVLGQAWDQAPRTVFPLDIQSWFQPRPVLTAERANQIAAGTDRDGRGMLNLTTGIEMNAAVLYKNHVNGFFGGWGQGWWGLENDYRTPIAMTHKAGGLTFINHPGDWLKSRDNPAAAHDPANVQFFADILRDYDSCLGIEIYNGGDNVTKRDRELWDEMLRRLIPEGRQAFGFASDDAHYLQDIGRQADVFFMPANTVANLRAAMEGGCFLACSRIDRMRMMPDGNRELEFPSITKIVTDNDAATIALTVKDTEIVEWIAEGEVIYTGETLNLRDFPDEIKSYVRAQLIGPGGISATQAFAVDGGGDDSLNDAPTGWDKFSYDTLRWLTGNKIAFLVKLLVEQIGKLING